MRNTKYETNTKYEMRNLKRLEFRISNFDIKISDF